MSYMREESAMGSENSTFLKSAYGLQPKYETPGKYHVNCDPDVFLDATTGNITSGAEVMNWRSRNRFRSQSWHNCWVIVGVTSVFRGMVLRAIGITPSNERNILARRGKYRNVTINPGNGRELHGYRSNIHALRRANTMKNRPPGWNVRKRHLAVKEKRKDQRKMMP